MRCRTSMWALSALFLASLAASRAAEGGPLQVDRVSEKAQWVVHIDAEAARSSRVVQAYWQECLGEQRGVGALRWLREKWGFHVEEDLHALTLYGTRIGARRAVAVVHAKLDKQKIAERFREVSDPRTTQYEGHTIYSWPEDRARHQHEAAVVLYQPDLALVAADVDAAKSALDVLRGEAPGLKSDSPLAADVPPGAVCVARGIELDKNDLEWSLLDAVQRFDAVAVERDGRWTEKMTLVASSPDTAEMLEKWLEGIVAFVSLHFRQQSDVQDLIDRTEIEREDEVVKVSFETPVQPLIEVAPTICNALRHHLKGQAAWRGAMADSASTNSRR